jgi:chemotaxis protein methyltransferase CheR
MTNTIPKHSEAQTLQSFNAFCAYLRRSSGLVIGIDKQYLVESKIRPILRREKMAGLVELVSVLERGQAPALAKEVIEAMTVNETFFFRDKVPFDNFRQMMLPALIAARANEKCLRVWSAASSSGQEPYSLAMILLDEFAHKLQGWRIEVVGTDLSEAVLDKARKGVYTQFEVQRGLPTPLLLRHFAQVGDLWQINEKIRSRVTFTSFNLLSDYARLGKFDVIFCRNVLIYFDQARKSDILSRMGRILQPDGYLVLGASENIIGLQTGLAPHPQNRTFFIRAGAQGTSLPAPAATPAISFRP